MAVRDISMFPLGDLDYDACIYIHTLYIFDIAPFPELGSKRIHTHTNTHSHTRYHTGNNLDTIMSFEIFLEKKSF